jgi:hypothetical protein
MQQTITLKGEPRPVRMDVVEAIDDVLKEVGNSEVMHAIDPTRIASFADGGPPVWSVGVVQVVGDQPYTLFVTYGFSHTLSPGAERNGIEHELSLAVPAHCETQPWAVALLRHLARYVLSSGNELMVGDVMPCHAPITRIPFPPQHHGMVPATHLDSIVIVPDPLIGEIETAHGVIEVRRIVGVTINDLHRIGPTPPPARVSTLRSENPRALTNIG